ncbi:hypothetical protein ACIQUM_07250 [Amycolatopsis azurea]|uniref:hypothetical protein n=1 Tax=Amycolatopsis azurea TaxID=36819 RepID=UPI00381E1B7E
MTAWTVPAGEWRDRAGRRPSVMADHPGWRLDGEGRLLRLLRSSGVVWLAVGVPASGGGHTLAFHMVDGDRGADPVVDVADPAMLDGAPGLREALLAAGPVARVRTCDLWDALVGAVFRCTTPLECARTLYRDAAVGLGAGYDTPMGREWVFPSPGQILALPEEVFDAYGLRRVRDRLRSAASVVRAMRSGWRHLSWNVLYSCLAQMPRDGPQIAGAAVADLSGDYRFVVSSDFLVRKQVHALDPGASWPENALRFSFRWQAMTGMQRSDWTLLLLAHGIRHAPNPVP